MIENDILSGVENVKDIQINESFLNFVPNLKEVNELAERLDFFDIIILRKFYMNNKDSSMSTKPYCFPLLFKEMKDLHKMKIGIEALRKRLKVLSDIGLVVKVDRSNPSSYLPSNQKQFFF